MALGGFMSCANSSRPNGAAWQGLGSFSCNSVAAGPQPIRRVGEATGLAQQLTEAEPVPVDEALDSARAVAEFLSALAKPKAPAFAAGLGGGLLSVSAGSG